MKKIFTLVLLAVCALSAMAQPDAMKFAGPSTFGVAAMNAWQENESDTIVFVMNSTSEADITLPAMTYNAMGVTIPSITIHGLQFSFDYATMNASFADQTFTETILVDDVEKTITGTSFVAEYNHESKTFDLTTTMNYGSMPFPVTYSINAVYLSDTTTAIDSMSDEAGGHTTFDLMGRKLQTAGGGFMIVDGKMILKR